MNRVCPPFSGAAGKPDHNRRYCPAPQQRSVDYIRRTKNVQAPSYAPSDVIISRPPNLLTSKGAGKHRKHQYLRNKGPPNNLDYDQAIISALDRIENADRHGKPMSQIIREKNLQNVTQ